MASIYSKRLFGGYFSAAGVHTLFTAAAGYVTIVRCITVACYSANVNSGYIYVPGTLLLDGWSNIPQLTAQIHEMRQVLNAGDVVDLDLTLSDVFVAISGYQLNL